MKTLKTIQYKFVEFIPESLSEGVIYVSLEYATAVHLCVCGCSNEVVTPLSPTDWSLYFDGETISLSPSIGNWEFECKSHYWIKRNEIIHAKTWSKAKIAEGRKADSNKKKKWYEGDVKASLQKFLKFW